jgi:hypothetical protein
MIFTRVLLASSLPSTGSSEFLATGHASPKQILEHKDPVTGTWEMLSKV